MSTDGDAESADTTIDLDTDATRLGTTPPARRDEFLAGLMIDTLRYARERDYTGWDYFDGMSSGVLKGLPFDNKWVNIAVQEGIKRAPINLRPLFLVEQRQNYKGSALFSMANLTAADVTGDDLYEREAIELAEWLIDNAAEGYAGFAGGHTHEMQLLDERRDAYVPNAIPTSFAVKALLRVAERTGEERYAEIAKTATEFVYQDLEYRELEGGARIKYQPEYTGEFYTLNCGAIAARMLIDLYEYFGDEELRERAGKLLDYLATKQHDIGGWTYRDPPSASHLSMDNHHNGFIIEGFLRYREVTGEDRHADTIEKSLAFYRNVLFEDDGAPNWEEDAKYPKDIHAATQGIIVFSMAGDLAFARRIVDWVLGNLYAGNGKFWFRRQRFYTKRFTLMRWCEAWMAYSLAEHLRYSMEAE